MICKITNFLRIFFNRKKIRKIPYILRMKKIRKIRILDLCLPKAEHATDDLCCPVIELIAAHSSPRTVAQNLQPSFVRIPSSYQSHCNNVNNMYVGAHAKVCLSVCLSVRQCQYAVDNLVTKQCITYVTEWRAWA